MEKLNQGEKSIIEKNCDLIKPVFEPAPLVRQVTETNIGIDSEDDIDLSKKNDIANITSDSNEEDSNLQADMKKTNRQHFVSMGHLSRVVEENSITSGSSKSEMKEI